MPLTVVKYDLDHKVAPKRGVRGTAGLLYNIKMGWYFRHASDEGGGDGRNGVGEDNFDDYLD